MKIIGVQQEQGLNIQGENSSLPIGSIIDWWRPTGSFAVPTEYKQADGSLISDPTSPYDGFNAPDLVDAFIISTTSLASINQTGGEDDIDLTHSHGSTSHTHDATHVHTVEGADGGDAGSLVNTGGSDGSEFPHHHINETTPPQTQDFSLTTSASMSFNSTVDSISKLPLHIGVLKLIKINYGLKVVHADNILNANIIHRSSGVPVGGIVPWWTDSGSPASFQSNFQLCDGTIISDTNSSFNGFNTPNLLTRFLRGVAPVNINTLGGANSQSTTHNHPVSCPGHSLNHSHSGTIDGTNIDVEGINAAGSDIDVTLEHDHFYTTNDTNLTFPSFSGTSSSSGPSIDTIPSYFTLVYLVRIY